MSKTLIQLYDGVDFFSLSFSQREKGLLVKFTSLSLSLWERVCDQTVALEQNRVRGLEFTHV